MSSKHMPVVELDPLFVKALKLLHSKKKDAVDQLKQMLDDVLAERKGGQKNEGTKERTSPNNKTAGIVKKDPLDGAKRREAEKRSFDKIHQDLEDLSEGSPQKKPKIEPTDVKTDKNKDVDRKHKDAHSKDSRSGKDKAREREREDREKEKERLAKEKEKEQEKKKEEIPWKRKIEMVSSDSDTESDGDNKLSKSMVDDFAFDEGLACVVCRSFDVASGNQLVECQECHNLYHQECHRPAVLEDVNDPRFVWYCYRCSKNLKKVSKSQQKNKSSHSSSNSHKEVPSAKPIKSELSSSTVQPFKRVEAHKPGKESSSGGSSKPFSGLTGLASLAANFGGKTTTSDPKHSSSSSSKPKSTSVTTMGAKPPAKTAAAKAPTLRQFDMFQNLSTLAPAAPKSGSGSSSLSKSGSAKVGSGSSSFTKSSGSKAMTPAELLVKSGVKSSLASSKSSSSSFSSAVTAKSGSVSSSTSKGSSSSSSSSSGSGRSSSSSIMTADKRLQIMKKKAAAKQRGFN